MAEGPAYAERRAALLALLRPLERLAVAFSGGVDSSVLLHAGVEVLGEGCVAVVADSPSLPRAELAGARRVAASVGARLVELATAELEDPRYVRNAGDRCYFCKAELFEHMSAWAREEGFSSLAFGEITDDLADDRPGARAAAEFRVRAPLREAGFSKEDVRRYAAEAGLEVAHKPASACLASRVPRGVPVTAERLATIEQAEAELHARGYEVLRVRHHGRRALVEVGEAELPRARDEQDALGRILRGHGFEELELGVYLPPALR